MGRILVVVLGVGCILAGAWWVLTHRTATDPSQSSEAKAKLDNVHNAADRIEGQMKQREDEAAKEPYAQ